MKEAQVFRVKTLRKEIIATETKTKARLDKKVERKLNREQHGVRTLSKHKFVEKETQPLLSDELPKGLLGAGGSIGTGDLLLDRFKSFQKRNVLEPTIKHKYVFINIMTKLLSILLVTKTHFNLFFRQKRKNKPKMYIRDCDKMEWEKTGIWNGEKLALPSGRRRPKPAPRNKKNKNRKY
jgi:hypothetical protein